MVQCSACGRYLNRRCFSARQLRCDVHLRRCLYCLGHQLPIIHDNDDDDDDTLHEDEEEEEQDEVNDVARRGDNNDDDAEIDDQAMSRQQPRDRTHRCAACRRKKKACRFSTRQLEKGHARRCQACVTNKVQAPVSNDTTTHGGSARTEQESSSSSPSAAPAAATSSSPASEAALAAATATAAAASTSSHGAPVTHVSADEFLCPVCMEVMYHREEQQNQDGPFFSSGDEGSRNSNNNSSSSTSSNKRRIAKILPNCSHICCAGCLACMERSAPDGTNPKCPTCRADWHPSHLVDLPPAFKTMIDYVSNRCRWFKNDDGGGGASSDAPQMKHLQGRLADLINQFHEEHGPIISNKLRTTFFDETVEFVTELTVVAEFLETMMSSGAAQLCDQIKQQEEELAMLKKDLARAQERDQQIQTLRSLVDPIRAACESQQSLMKLVAKNREARKEKEKELRAKQTLQKLKAGRGSGVVNHVNLSRRLGGVTLDRPDGSNEPISLLFLGSDAELRSLKRGDRVFFDIVPNPRKPGEFLAHKVRRHDGGYSEEYDGGGFDPLLALFGAGGGGGGGAAAAAATAAGRNPGIVMEDHGGMSPLVISDIVMQIAALLGPQQYDHRAFGGARGSGNRQAPRQQQQPRATAAAAFRSTTTSTFTAAPVTTRNQSDDDDGYAFQMSASASQVD